MEYRIKDGVAIGEDAPWHRLGNQCGALDGYVWHSPAGELAAVLEFAPPVAGTFDVYARIRSSGFQDPFGEFVNGVYLKRREDTCWTLLSSEIDEDCYQELYFDRVTLAAGEAIQVASFRMETRLDHLRFVAASGESPRAAALRQPAAQIVAGICDIPDETHLSMPDGLEAASCVWRHARAGFNRLYWRACAVKCEYWTKIGEIRDVTTNLDGQGAVTRQGKTIEPILRLYDVLAQAVAEAKRCGLPIYGWMRINNEMAKKAHQFSMTRLHREHPEYRQVYRNGDPSPRLSFAWPEVRAFKTALAVEIAGYGVDGILVDCLRHPPMVQYEPIVVDAFIAAHGDDPRQMEGDGTDAWLRFRAGYFTQFLRELRAALRERFGNRLKLAVRGYSWPSSNLRHGLDVDAWLAEGLIDELVVALYCNKEGNYSPDLDYRAWKELAGSRIQVIGQVWRFGSMPTAEVLARRFREQGLDGVAFYESNLLLHQPSKRERVWRFRDPERWL